MTQITKSVAHAIPGHPQLPWTASADVGTNKEGQKSTNLVQLDFPAQGLHLKELNASLVMHKYAFGPLPKGEETRLFKEVFGVAENDRLRDEGNYKRLALEGAVRASTSLPVSKSILRHLHERRRLADYSGTWDLACPSRLLTGLGQKGVWETNVRIHSLWGFPVLDGSGLKGIARAWASLSWLEETEPGAKRLSDKGRLLGAAWPDAPESLKSTSILRALSILLGHGAADSLDIDSKDETGGILIVQDAFPDSIPADRSYYTPEVINPHYGQYYGSSGDSAPSDRSDPSPTFHVAIRDGLVFSFAVSIDRAHWNHLDRSIAPDSSVEDWLALAKFCLTQALVELGFGSKSGTGYGFFSEHRPVAASPKEEQTRVLEFVDAFSSFPEATRERARTVSIWTVDRFLQKKGERDQLANALHGPGSDAPVPSELVDYLKSAWSQGYATLDKKDKREIRDWLNKHGIDWSSP